MPERRALNRVPIVTVLALLIAGTPHLASGQTVRGSVIDDLSERAIPVVAVTLLDRDGKGEVQVLTDDAGRFVLTIPMSGEYSLRADALGYEAMVSPLLALSADREYQLDLIIHPAPLGLGPLVVTAERYEKWVRLWTGINPASVLGKVMAGDEWRQLALPGRDLVDALRWAELPGAFVQRGTSGPCVTAGRTTCLPIYVDGMLWQGEQVQALSLEEVEAVVYLRSTSPSTLFQHRGHFNQRDPNASGRIMIFRKGFLRY